MGFFSESFKQRIFAAGHVNLEEEKLLVFLDNLQLTSQHKVLDVGCGYGSKLKLLEKKEFQLMGVEVNIDIVKANQKNGLNCISVSEFNLKNEKYDVLLFSHIIEHFSPDALLIFLDSYLDRLNPGGHIIIITPIFTERFYNDFDHVKPYYPTAIQMVFGKNESQVQYYSRNKLEIKDIWFRRSPIQLNLLPGIYVSHRSRVPNYINLLLRLLFRASFGLVSQKDTWMGIYKKVT